MKCPRCDEELQSRTIGTVRIEECPQCRGIWLDEDDLRRAKDEADPDLRWMDFGLWKHEDRFAIATKPVRCPRCKIEMAAVDYDNTKVVVDCCAKCKGVWLDGAEFSKIIDALSEELLTKSVSDYARVSLKEAEEIITGPEGLVSEWKDFLTVLRMLEYRVFSKNPTVNKALSEIQARSPFW
jgi:Zn-finger nucleic acid-binding protein